MTEAGDLNELMTDTAEALAQVRPRPGDWPEWVVILLRELERQAMEIELDPPEYYELMLDRLGDTIADRLSGRKWPPVM